MTRRSLTISQRAKLARQAERAAAAMEARVARCKAAKRHVPHRLAAMMQAARTAALALARGIA